MPESFEFLNMTEKVKSKIEKVKKIDKKKNPMGELTDEEREAVTIVFHQFETGLREGTIFTKVEIEAQILLCLVSTEFKQDSWGRYTLFPSQFAFKSTDEHHFSWIGHVANTPIRDGG